MQGLIAATLAARSGVLSLAGTSGLVFREGGPSGATKLTVVGHADDITAAGLRPGLWMAPFYVSRDSATYLRNI